MTAVPAVPANDGIPMDQQEKQGGKCCNCCCDYRRAVIALAIVSIVFGILGLAAQGQNNNNTSAIGDDDLVQDFVEDIEELEDKYQTGSIVMAVLGFAMAFVSLGGGIWFNWVMVAISAVYVIIAFIVGIIIGLKQLNEFGDIVDVHTEGETSALTESEEEGIESFVRLLVIIGYAISAIITFLFVYPSFCFVKEVRSGIMSKETYPREKFSCCCT